jgi:hypothetical protein
VSEAWPVVSCEQGTDMTAALLLDELVYSEAKCNKDDCCSPLSLGDSLPLHLA